MAAVLRRGGPAVVAGRPGDYRAPRTWASPASSSLAALVSMPRRDLRRGDNGFAKGDDGMTPGAMFPVVHPVAAGNGGGPGGNSSRWCIPQKQVMHVLLAFLVLAAAASNLQ
jgi:hypothetical protein